MLMSSVAQALVFTENLLFESTNQSMWSEGGGVDWGVEIFSGTKWGTYAGNSPVDKSIGIDVGAAASVRGGFQSSGEVGIMSWANASGGSIDISLPTQATVLLPDSVRENHYFKVSTSSSIQSTADITAK